MKIYTIFILVLINLQILAGQPNQIALITAKTDAPVLLDKPGNSYLMTEVEYKKIITNFAKNPNFIPIKRKPKNLGFGARFGFNLVINRKNIGWILDGDEKRGFTLYADWNADGDLTNDVPVKFKNKNGAFSNSYRTMVAETVGNQKQKYPFGVRLEVAKIVPPGKSAEELVLKSSDSTMRRGRLDIGNRKIGFALTGWGGLYDNESNKLYFDLNGDGDFEIGEPYSAEIYKVSEKRVNIGGRTFEFSVVRYGNSLTLKPLAEKMPDRADLSPGNLAPDISFKDLDGVSHQLSDFRGRVVLLDFWGLWCAPCIAEAPNLAATYKKLKDKGFEVISFDKGDTVENLRKFIAKFEMNWTHSQVEDGLSQLYRINGYPTYFLLDKDGKIISNSLRPGAEMYQKVEEMLEK